MSTTSKYFGNTVKVTWPVVDVGSVVPDSIPASSWSSASELTEFDPNEPAWRDDPEVRALVGPESGVHQGQQGRPGSMRQTAVLVDGVCVMVALSRSDALVAGFVVLDADRVPPSSSTNASNSSSTNDAAPGDRSEDSVADWLRDLSRRRWTAQAVFASSTQPPSVSIARPPASLVPSFPTPAPSPVFPVLSDPVAPAPTKPEESVWVPASTPATLSVFTIPNPLPVSIPVSIRPSTPAPTRASMPPSTPASAVAPPRFDALIAAAQADTVAGQPVLSEALFSANNPSLTQMPNPAENPFSSTSRTVDVSVDVSFAGLVGISAESGSGLFGAPAPVLPPPPGGEITFAVPAETPAETTTAPIWSPAERVTPASVNGVETPTSPLPDSVVSRPDEAWQTLDSTAAGVAETSIFVGWRAELDEPASNVFQLSQQTIDAISGPSVSPLTPILEASPIYKWVKPLAPIAPDAPIVVSAEEISKAFRTNRKTIGALHNVSLSVAAGEFVVITGPSGSGKTTLLNCLAGFDNVDSGQIVVDGYDVAMLSDAERTRHRSSAMGFVFQSYNLLVVLSAVENVEVPLLLNGWAGHEARTEALAALALVDLADRADHLPDSLSGGEQQRVTIARALVGEPKLLWADEPTGNLDPESTANVIHLLRELNADGLTVVMVTHDPTIAALAHRRIELRDGQIIGARV